MILRLATANENRSEREGAASVVPSPHLPVGETYFQRSREAAEGLAPSAVVFEPEERTDTVNLLEFHFQTAAGHGTPLSPPAGLVVQVDTVHVKAFAYPLDLALRLGFVFQEDLQRECHAILVP